MLDQKPRIGFKMSEQKLIDLETRFLYQEDTIEQLNKVVTEQQKEIQQLKSMFGIISKNLSEVLKQNEDIRGHEKPPHYWLPVICIDGYVAQKKHLTSQPFRIGDFIFLFGFFF